MSSNSKWFSDFDDDFSLFSRPRRHLLSTDPWGSLERLHEDLETSDIFADFANKAAHLRSRVAEGRIQRQSPVPLRNPGLRRASEQSVGGIASPTPSSVNSSAFNYSEGIQGVVSFPTSSCSNVSDCSDKSVESICTEKSANHSAVSEALPDGGEQRQVDNTESWVERNTCGSVVGEGSASESIKSMIRPGSFQELRKQESSYTDAAGGSHTSSHTSEERSSQTSTLKSKSLKQTTTSTKETSECLGGKPFRVRPNRSIFYDELDSSLLSDTVLGARRRRPLDHVSSLVDEVVHHDRLFQAELDDFFNGRGRSKRTSRLFPTSDAGRDEGLNRCKTSIEDLRRENETLQSENSRLQQVLQEVTAVNKRWQRYNNDRRMYVQKLLATIQELQEQMNQQGEAAIQRPSATAASCDADVELDRLRRQHEEHNQLLRLQIKSHKDDWDVERREKNKAILEKETLVEEVLKLNQEVTHLRTMLNEERERASCCSCPVRDTSHITSQDFSPRPSYQASFQVPYSPVEEINSNISENVTYNIVEKEDKIASEETVDSGNVADNEPYSVTPRPQSQPLSLYLGFPDSGLSTVRAFSSQTEYTCRAPTPPHAPSREDHESIVCPNCSRVFPKALRIPFKDHFEFCKNTDENGVKYSFS